MDDAARPFCQVALCNRRASYKTTDVDGQPVYCCVEHRPFVAAMGRLLSPDELDEVQG